MSEILVDFYDQLKSRTRGYASLDYAAAGYRPGDLVKLDVLVGGDFNDVAGSAPYGAMRNYGRGSSRGCRA